MMPSARRRPRVRHLGERLVQERMPVPHADVDRQRARRRAASAARRPSAWRARQLVERRAAADQLVVVRDLLEALGRDAAARACTISRNGRMSSRASPVRRRRSAGRRRRRVIATDSSWTMSTSARTWSTGVSGRMPWPRLKMWPGPAARRASRIALRPRGGSRRRAASSTAGSRLPCTATSWPSRAHVGAELDAPVEADHVAARLAHERQQRRGAGAEVDDRHARRAARRITRARCAAARTSR